MSSGLSRPGGRGIDPPIPTRGKPRRALPRYYNQRSLDLAPRPKEYFNPTERSRIDDLLQSNLQSRSRTKCGRMRLSLALIYGVFFACIMRTLGMLALPDTVLPDSRRAEDSGQKQGLSLFPSLGTHDTNQ
ncbi:hypothetical protein CYMTET_38579, partial [Cymbomonas tetramitiformis]